MFVLEGVGRMRVGEEKLTVPKHGGVLVGPDQLRQVFNDTDTEVLWSYARHLLTAELGEGHDILILSAAKVEIDGCLPTQRIDLVTQALRSRPLWRFGRSSTLTIRPSRSRPGPADLP
jgi:hypothetical protein